MMTEPSSWDDWTEYRAMLAELKAASDAIDDVVRLPFEHPERAAKRRALDAALARVRNYLREVQ